MLDQPGGAFGGLHVFGVVKASPGVWFSGPVDGGRGSSLASLGQDAHDRAAFLRQRSQAVFILFGPSKKVAESAARRIELERGRERIVGGEAGEEFQSLGSVHIEAEKIGYRAHDDADVARWAAAPEQAQSGFVHGLFLVLLPGPKRRLAGAGTFLLVHAG